MVTWQTMHTSFVNSGATRSLSPNHSEHLQGNPWFLLQNQCVKTASSIAHSSLSQTKQLDPSDVASTHVLCDVVRRGGRAEDDLQIMEDVGSNLRSDVKIKNCHKQSKCNKFLSNCVAFQICLCLEPMAWENTMVTSHRYPAVNCMLLPADVHGQCHWLAGGKGQNQFP